jgi:cysteine synthase A
MLHDVLYKNITETTYHTPLVKLNRLIPAGHATVLVKLEFFNPLSSVKDRIGRAMIEAAERSGQIRPGFNIIEPTSGNTGIALAFVGAAKGYKVTLAMPESMSIERRALLAALGARVVLTPAKEGMKGAIAKAQQLAAELPNSWIPQQFDNPANVEVHERTTAQEVLADFGNAPFDALITGVGTGGHITGLARILKKAWPNLKVFAVEPALSPILNGGKPGPHPIQGLGANFVPSILGRDLLDGVIDVDAEDAREMARRSAREEGVLIGISSGASLAAIEMKLPDLGPRPRILTFNYDSGERYLSVPDFLPQEG